MRVLVLENEMTSTRGGQELSLLDVCEGLAARGHSIVLAYVTSGDLEPRYRQICERMIRVSTYSIDRSRTLSSLGDLASSLWAVAGSAPDVVYANQYLDSLFAAIVRRLHRVPFVCHLRLPPPDPICGQFRIGMEQASHLIAISEQTRRDWIARGFRADAIDVVYNGIDSGQFDRRGDPAAARAALGLPAEPLVLTYAGRLHPAKGVETLIDAFSLVARERPCHLVLAGRAAVMNDEHGRPRDYLGELRGAAERLGVASAITWIVHQRDMPALLRASDLTVLPSLWSEPFGRIVIESMACETPVVASRAGGIPEILTGEFSEWLFEAGQAADLAAHVTRLAGWRASDPALGRRARAHVVNTFSIDRMVDGVERALLLTIDRFNLRAPLGVVASRIH
jgi:glycosyltransferase involved in cell wall biosynthesis